MVQKPVLLLLSVAVPSVSSVQAGVLSVGSDHNADEGSEKAAQAERAADEAAGHGRNGGDLADHEEVLSAEAMWADGGGNDTGQPAQARATATGQVGYLPEGMRVRVVGLTQTRSSQHNSTLRVVDYTQQSMEGDECEQQLV